MPGNYVFSDEEAREFISLIFDGYQKRKKENRLYAHDGIAQMIIKTYYTYVDKPCFSQLVSKFKKRYLYNENKVEDVKSKEEQDGLSKVYDYILEKDLNDVSIYDISYIHEKLYSKTLHPEFGGKYRNEDLYLLGENGSFKTGSVELEPYWNITHAMNELRPDVADLVNNGIKLKKNKDPEGIINYINKCVELKCKLIKIHPFRDGNGRSIRAFINLLFRLANIPPVYISNREKESYQKAMNIALVAGNYEHIKEFYMYKICDSIMVLDVEDKEKKYYDKEDSMNTVDMEKKL